MAIDLIIAAIAVFCTWRGFKNGIVRGICGILALIISIFTANLIATAYSGEFTGMLKPFVGGVVDTVISDVLEDDERYEGIESFPDMNAFTFSALRKLGLPESAAEIIADAVSGGEHETVGGLSESITETLSSALAYTAVFGVCFALCAIVFAVIGNLINRVFSIPGLEQLDSLLGAAFGIIKGLVIIYAMAVVVRYIGLVAAPVVEKTILLKYLININPIAGILGI